MRHPLLVPTVLLICLAGGLLVAQERTQSPVRPPEKGPIQLGLDRLLKDFDRNGDGFLQQDEAPGYIREQLAQLDLNKDGKLSLEELERGVAYLQPRRRPSDVVYVLIEMSDCDHDCTGEVQRAYDALRKIDANKDGKIEGDELKAARQQILDERVDGILKDLDTNKDSKVSKEEARGLLRRDFDHLDTNKDGFVNRDELLKAAAEKPAKPPEPKEINPPQKDPKQNPNP